MRSVLLAMAALLVVTAAWANPPLESGVVVRFQDTFAVAVGDGRTGLIAIAGLDVDGLRDFCSPACQDDGMCPPFEVVDFQTVVNPSDDGLFMDNVAGRDLSASVWPRVGTGLCDLVNNFNPIAWGTVDLRQTDNDFFAFLFERDRTNAYGNTFHGRLTTSNGGTAQLNAHFRCVFDPGQIFFCTTHVNLN